jgi:hypothetical protein
MISSLSIGAEWILEPWPFPTPEQSCVRRLFPSETPEDCAVSSKSALIEAWLRFQQKFAFAIAQSVDALCLEQRGQPACAQPPLVAPNTTLITGVVEHKTSPYLDLCRETISAQARRTFRLWLVTRQVLEK